MYPPCHLAPLVLPGAKEGTVIWSTEEFCSVWLSCVTALVACILHRGWQDILNHFFGSELDSTTMSEVPHNIPFVNDTR